MQIKIEHHHLDYKKEQKKHTYHMVMALYDTLKYMPFWKTIQTNSYQVYTARRKVMSYFSD